jgi:hypothetical protein
MRTPELGFDPRHVVVGGDAAGPVFGDGLERPAQPLVGDRPRKSHYSVLNLDADPRPRRRLVVLTQWTIGKRTPYSEFISRAQAQ